MDAALEQVYNHASTHTHTWNAILVIILIWNAYGFGEKCMNNLPNVKLDAMKLAIRPEILGWRETNIFKCSLVSEKHRKPQNMSALTEHLKHIFDVWWNGIAFTIISFRPMSIPSINLHTLCDIGADIKVPNIQSVHKIDALFVMQCTAIPLRLGFDSALENWWWHHGDCNQHHHHQWTLNI